ncbi:MAG: TolC family protein [Myxococcaceae bacterium]|nr:TolC family protein [Myxococcaceae bacterium]
MRLFLLLFMANTTFGNDFSLEDAETSALQNSELLKVAETDLWVAKQQKQAVLTTFFPKLAFQSNYTYLSKLPSLTVNPAIAPIPLGDHSNYSMGLSLSYVLWDHFSTWHSYQAIGYTHQSKEQDLKALTQTLEIRQLDSLRKLLEKWKSFKPSIQPSDFPALQSLQLLSKATLHTARSLVSRLYPSITLDTSTALVYPNGPVLQNINQNTISINLSLPLWLGDPNWSLISAKKREAEAMKHQAAHLVIEHQRDTRKATAQYQSLLLQQRKSKQENRNIAESARLFYASYQTGKSTFLEVLAANHQLLQSQIAQARINAQLLSQMITLIALGGKINS